MCTIKKCTICTWTCITVCRRLQLRYNSSIQYMVLFSPLTTPTCSLLSMTSSSTPTSGLPRRGCSCCSPCEWVEGFCCEWEVVEVAHSSNRENSVIQSLEEELLEAYTHKGYNNDCIRNTCTSCDEGTLLTQYTNSQLKTLFMFGWLVPNTPFYI